MPINISFRVPAGLFQGILRRATSDLDASAIVRQLTRFTAARERHFLETDVTANDLHTEGVTRDCPNCEAGLLMWSKSETRWLACMVCGKERP